jgi:hypothetical protein
VHTASHPEDRAQSLTDTPRRWYFGLDGVIFSPDQKVYIELRPWGHWFQREKTFVTDDFGQLHELSAEAVAAHTEYFFSQFHGACEPACAWFEARDRQHHGARESPPPVRVGVCTDTTFPGPLVQRITISEDLSPLANQQIYRIDAAGNCDELWLTRAQLAALVAAAGPILVPAEGSEVAHG